MEDIEPRHCLMTLLSKFAKIVALKASAWWLPMIQIKTKYKALIVSPLFLSEEKRQSETERRKLVLLQKWVVHVRTGMFTAQPLHRSKSDGEGAEQNKWWIRSWGAWMTRWRSNMRSMFQSALQKIIKTLYFYLITGTSCNSDAKTFGQNLKTLCMVEKKMFRVKNGKKREKLKEE